MVILEWEYYTIHTAKLTPFREDRKRQMRRLGKNLSAVYLLNGSSVYTVRPAIDIESLFFFLKDKCFIAAL